MVQIIAPVFGKVNYYYVKITHDDVNIFMKINGAVVSQTLAPQAGFWPPCFLEKQKGRQHHERTLPTSFDDPYSFILFHRYRISPLAKHVVIGLQHHGQLLHFFSPLLFDFSRAYRISQTCGNKTAASRTASSFSFASFPGPLNFFRSLGTIVMINPFS